MLPAPAPLRLPGLAAAHRLPLSPTGRRHPSPALPPRPWITRSPLHAAHLRQALRRGAARPVTQRPAVSGRMAGTVPTAREAPEAVRALHSRAGAGARLSHAAARPASESRTRSGARQTRPLRSVTHRYGPLRARLQSSSRGIDTAAASVTGPQPRKPAHTCDPSSSAPTAAPKHAPTTAAGGAALSAADRATRPIRPPPGPAVWPRCGRRAASASPDTPPPPSPLSPTCLRTAQRRRLPT